MQLPGVITRGTKAAPERPSAASAIRPRPAPVAAQPAKAQQAKVQPAKAQPAKAAPKAQPKKKPVEDDE
jgi:hypothetical protein